MKKLFLILVLLLPACGGGEPACLKGLEHDYGNWTETGTSNAYGEEWLCRTCRVCGWKQVRVAAYTRSW